MESAFILGGSAGASSADGLDWANLSAGNALDAWDFLTDQARFNSVAVGPLANTPGWSFTRASTGYAQTSAGALTAFASGELRRTDKGVLIEGARTNLCLQSQAFDNAAWTKSLGGAALAPVVTANQDTAPDGTLTADRVVFDLNGGTASGDISSLEFTPSAPGAYTASFYARTTDGTSKVLRVVGPGGTGGNVTITGTWERHTLVDGVSAGANLRIRLRGSASGEGTATSASIYIWGAQLEAAAFPSSYIPTTTAPATRAADVLSITGVTGLDYPLSLFAEFERAVDTGGAERLLQVDANSINNLALIYVDPSDRLELFAVAGGSQQNSSTPVTGALAVATVYKGAARFATNDLRAARGGSLGTNDTTATAPATPSVVRFGQSSGGTEHSFGYLRRAAIWNRALTDAELQSVTT